MREIKFRAWDIIFKTMSPWEALLQRPMVILNHKPSIVCMQFTGLRDRNGVEIYEGDIVRFNHRIDHTNFWEEDAGWWKDERTDGTVILDGIIEWCSGAFTLKTDRWHLLLREPVQNTMEVIGNIYQNAELLTR